jgi:hypothetical protein
MLFPALNVLHSNYKIYKPAFSKLIHHYKFTVPTRSPCGPDHLLILGVVVDGRKDAEALAELLGSSSAPPPVTASHPRCMRALSTTQQHRYSTDSTFQPFDFLELKGINGTLK